MTWGTTHVALEAFIVWIGMGKKNREIFKAKRGLFTLLTLFALFPDVDTFIYIHRTYFHSVVWPLFLILGVFVWLIISKYFIKKPLGTKADLAMRCLILIGSFVILHDILDFTTGPILFFYPFDDRLYNLDAYMIWDLNSPFLLGGFEFEWTTISLKEGIDTFFLNMTPDERIEYFGSEFIYLYVSDFPLHAIIFLGWVAYFPIYAFIGWLRTFPKPKLFFTKFNQLRNPLIIGGLILLSFGLTLGPTIGLNHVENRQNVNWVLFSPEEVNYGFARSFELDKGDTLKLYGNYAGNNSICNISVVIANNEQYTNFSNTLDDLFEQYTHNNSLPYNWLTTNYQNITQDFLLNSLITYTIIPNSTEEIFYKLTEKNILYSVVLLVDWNTSIDFHAQTLTVSTLLIKRPIEFSFGIIFSVLGFVALLTPLLVTIHKKKSTIHAKEKISTTVKNENIENNEKI